MAMQAARRLNRIERVINLIEGPAQIKINRLSGEKAVQAEKRYILTQARATLGECEPDNTIFVSRRVKQLKAEYPGFPHQMIRKDAQTLIEKYND